MPFREVRRALCSHAAVCPAPRRRASAHTVCWNCLLERTVCRRELSSRENCLLGRTVSWRELSSRENCLLERTVSRIELYPGENCLLERIVCWRELSAGENCQPERTVSWRELSAGELVRACPRHQQEPQGNNEDVVKVQLGIC